MKCLVRAVLSNAGGNALVRDPNFAQRIQTVLEDLRPDAVYFAPDGGQRAIYAICDLESGADVARLAEPLWLSFNASVEIIPLITSDEMQQAGPALGQLGQRYP